MLFLIQALAPLGIGVATGEQVSTVHRNGAAL